MNEIVIVDPQTVRVLNSIQVASTSEAEGIFLDLPGADPDDIFSDAFTAVNDADDVEFSAELLQQFLSESGTGDIEIGGDWHFIILRLNKGVSAAAFISSLNKKIGSYGLAAVNWRIASGSSAIMTLLLQALFNFGIILVSIIGIIAIINILLISVFRRIREIGTLRAIGASDVYIRSLVYCENLFVSLLAGFAGIIGGLLFLSWVNSLDLHISNELIVSMLNRTVLQLEVLPYIACFSFVVAALLGLAATVYPVETAVRLEPVAAVSRG
jgi:ABC-type antimicrobial peptide transport system permease subunit